METWKFITGFENYEVSDLGRVRNNRGRVLKSASNNRGKGYLFVILSRNGKQHNRKIHRLVAEAFLPNVDNRPTVNHEDGNTKNNLPNNLSWMTMKEQMQHSIKNGLSPVGCKHYRAKVTEKDVKEILNLRHQGKRQKEIAKMFGITREAVSRICTGKNWKSLTKGQPNYSRVSRCGNLFIYEINKI